MSLEEGGGIAAVRQVVSGAWSQPFDFLGSNGAWYSRDIGATYTPGVGWEDVLSNPGDSNFYRGVGIGLDFLAPAITVTGFSVSYSRTPGTTDGTFTDLHFLATTSNGLASALITTTPPNPFVFSGSSAGAHGSFALNIYCSAHVGGDGGGSVTVTGITLTGEGVNPFKPVLITFSDDFGDTSSTFEVGENAGDVGYDIDDFGAGVHICAAALSIKYTTAYDGTGLDTLTLTGVDGIAKIACIRVPFLLQSGETNGDSTALDFFYATQTPVSGKTFWLVDVDTSDGTINSQTDLTPIIGGTTYCFVAGMNSFAINGEDSELILGFAKPSGGGATVLLGSNDGGEYWEIRNTGFDGDYVYWQEGSLTTAVFSGADGQGYTKNRGQTISNKTGNFSGTSKGVIIFP